MTSISPPLYYTYQQPQHQQAPVTAALFIDETFDLVKSNGSGTMNSNRHQFEHHTIIVLPPSIHLNAITKDMVVEQFQYPMSQAATNLQVSVKALRSLCRKFGIIRWPYKQRTTASSMNHQYFEFKSFRAMMGVTSLTSSSSPTSMPSMSLVSQHDAQHHNDKVLGTPSPSSPSSPASCNSCTPVVASSSPITPSSSRIEKPIHKLKVSVSVKGSASTPCKSSSTLPKYFSKMQFTKFVDYQDNNNSNSSNTKNPSPLPTTTSLPIMSQVESSSRKNLQPQTTPEKVRPNEQQQQQTPVELPSFVELMKALKLPC